MIKPTIGRVVWYRPGPVDKFLANYDLGRVTDVPQPMAAHVVYVWGDRMVNLVVFDHNGEQHIRTSVPLVQEGDPRPPNGFFCEWMPYQKGQAAKTEKAEATALELGAAVRQHGLATK